MANGSIQDMQHQNKYSIRKGTKIIKRHITKKIIPKRFQKDFCLGNSTREMKKRFMARPVIMEVQERTVTELFHSHIRSKTMAYAFNH